MKHTSQKEILTLLVSIYSKWIHRDNVESGLHGAKGHYLMGTGFPFCKTEVVKIC